MKPTVNGMLAAWAAALLSAALLAGCGDALVGGRCAEGWVPAAQGCVPEAGDGAAQGADADAGADGAPDAQVIPGDAADDAPDAQSAQTDTDGAAQGAQDAQAVPGDAANAAPDAQTDPDDAADPADAGAAEAGPGCEDPLVNCNGVCVDTNTDPANCGACGAVCPTGICNAGVCRDARAGHLVLIGHSFESTRRDQGRVLGNAVFLAPSSSPRVLVFDQYADRSPGGAVANADAAITTVAGARTWSRRELTDPAHVSDVLSVDAYDVMLVYEQRYANDTQIDDLSKQFGDALASFALAGGVVIVLDGSRANGGTYPVAVATGLLNVTGVAPATFQTVELAAPADAVAAGVSASYRAEPVSVTFRTSEPYAVFTVDGAPAVLHRAVLR